MVAPPRDCPEEGTSLSRQTFRPSVNYVPPTTTQMESAADV